MQTVWWSPGYDLRSDRISQAESKSHPAGQFLLLWDRRLKKSPRDWEEWGQGRLGFLLGYAYFSSFKARRSLVITRSILRLLWTYLSIPFHRRKSSFRSWMNGEKSLKLDLSLACREVLLNEEPGQYVTILHLLKCSSGLSGLVVGPAISSK